MRARCLTLSILAPGSEPRRLRAAWNDTRIILRQVSPDSEKILELTLEPYRACQGDWKHLARSHSLKASETYRFLDYAAVFLENKGNYYGHGDHKSIPSASEGFLKERSTASARAQKLLVSIDRAQITTHARPPIVDLMLHLHMFRCTADAVSCRAYYEELTVVDGVFLEWRNQVVAQRPADSVFVLATTFVDESGKV